MLMKWLSNLRPSVLLAGSGVVAVVAVVPAGSGDARAGSASGRAGLERGLGRETWIGLVAVAAGGGADVAGRRSARGQQSSLRRSLRTHSVAAAAAGCDPSNAATE